VGALGLHLIVYNFFTQRSAENPGSFVLVHEVLAKLEVDGCHCATILPVCFVGWRMRRAGSGLERGL
jgi:hypothetical protein